MDAIENMLSRISAGALTDPAPPKDVLDTALRCAMTAPDHGRIRPARFIIVEGDARLKLGRSFADAVKRVQPDATPEALDREVKKPMRAPMVIVAVSSPKKEKIPEIEQTLSVGASIQNLMLALHAKGYGAIWRTGDAAYDNGVKRDLGLTPDDAIVGFIYAGTIATPPRQIERAQPEGWVRHLAV